MKICTRSRVRIEIVFQGVCSSYGIRLSQPCKRDGYQDPKNCWQCRCPDGFGGNYCENIQPSVNGMKCLWLSRGWGLWLSRGWGLWLSRGWGLWLSRGWGLTASMILTMWLTLYHSVTQAVVPGSTFTDFQWRLRSPWTPLFCFVSTDRWSQETFCWSGFWTAVHTLSTPVISGVIDGCGTVLRRKFNYRWRGFQIPVSLP